MVTKKNFKRKLNLACSKSESSLAMQYIYFYGGMAVVCNTHVLIKQCLKLHDFKDKEIELLEGKSLHKDSFVELLRYDYISVEGTEEEAYIQATKGKVKVKFPLNIAANQDDRMPDYEAVIPNYNDRGSNEIFGLDLNFVGLLADLTMDKDKKVKFQFSGHNEKALLATGASIGLEQELLLIMPIRVK